LESASEEFFFRTGADFFSLRADFSDYERTFFRPWIDFSQNVNRFFCVRPDFLQRLSRFAQPFAFACSATFLFSVI
jgi:hypothetical protein